MNEHIVDIKHEFMDILALVEHSIKTKHHVSLENIKIITKDGHYFKIQFKEATEIINKPYNLNKDEGL